MKMKRRITSEALIYFAVSMILMLVTNRLFYEGGRLISRNRFHYDLTLPIDSFIPFLPWTVTIYLGCFIWWAAFYWFITLQGRHAADRFFSALILAEGICFLFYVFFPTTNTRPLIYNNTIWDHMMRFLYRVDAPDNLFPSIHCMISWLCWVAIRDKKNISISFRLCNLFLSAAVCFSTLSTRQHVLFDVAGGILLGEACYWFMGHSRVLLLYSGFIDAICSFFNNRR